MVAGNGHAFGGVGVSDAVHVRSCRVNGRMNDYARGIHAVLALTNDVALYIYFYQVRGFDLAVMKSVGVNQEMVLIPGNLDSNVVEDEFAPA